MNKTLKQAQEEQLRKYYPHIELFSQLTDGIRLWLTERALEEALEYNYEHYRINKSLEYSPADEMQILK